jgi:hypothetical protein
MEAIASGSIPIEGGTYLPGSVVVPDRNTVEWVDCRTKPALHIREASPGCGMGSQIQTSCIEDGTQLRFVTEIPMADCRDEADRISL